MPKGKGTYGSKVGRPPEYESGGDIPVTNAQDRMAGGGDIDAYYAIGGNVRYVKGVQKNQKTASEKQAELDAKRDKRAARLKEKSKNRKRILKGPLAGPKKIKEETKHSDFDGLTQNEFEDSPKDTSSEYRPRLTEQNKNKTISNSLKFEPGEKYENVNTFDSERMFAENAKKRKALKAAKKAAKKAAGNKGGEYEVNLGPVGVSVEKEAVRKAKKAAKIVKNIGKKVVVRGVLASPTPVGIGYRGYKAAQTAKKVVKSGRRYAKKRISEYLTSQGWTPPKSAAKDAAKIAAEKAKNKKK